MTTITSWTYKTDRPVKDGPGWEPEPNRADRSFGGISPAGEEQVTGDLRRHGHVILTDSRHDRPCNHHIIGVGVGHDDAAFAESGRSMAAYYENGEAFGGRWWEDTTLSSSRAYYDQQHPRFAAKTGRA